MGEGGRKGGKGSNVQYSMFNIQCSISNVQYPMFKWGGPDSPTAQGRGGLMAWRRGNRGPANAQRRGVFNIQYPTEQYPMSK